MGRAFCRGLLHRGGLVRRSIAPLIRPPKSSVVLSEFRYFPHRLPGLVTADAIHAACKPLIEAGWLVMPARGGLQQKPRGVYPVSPRLMQVLS